MKQRDSRSQRGVSLVIVLLILVIVSMLGLAGARVSMSSERSARNERDYQLALQGAEAAILAAEADIDSRVDADGRAVFTNDNYAAFIDGCGSTAPSQGLCTPGSTPIWKQIDLATSTKAVQMSGYPSGSSGLVPAGKPRYVIEAVWDQAAGNSAGVDASTASNQYVYRITAMGFGPRADVQAVVQAVYRRSPG
jgi:type IV pilus assembly protein PilX